MTVLNSLKAVFYGCSFIVLTGLIVQLAYIFLAVGYIELAKSMPVLNTLDDYFRYLIGLPVFMLILATGGYITAATATAYRRLLCFIVGLLTAGIMLASAVYDYELTPTGYVLFSVSVFMPLVGGWYWQSKYL